MTNKALKEKFDFLRALKEKKCKIDSYSQFVFYASDKNFHFRSFDGETLEIGVRECFDRWANSVDFTCKIPKDVKGFEAFMLALGDCLKNKRYNQGIGQKLNINSLTRKARKGKL